MIKEVFEKRFKKAKDKNWDCIYCFVDVHETILVPTYDHTKTSHEFYPYAQKTFEHLTNRKDVKLILWTCSSPEQIISYRKFFKDHNIEFDYVNENPEVGSAGTAYGYYYDKPFFDVLFEDKAGFNPDEYESLYRYLLNNPELKQIEKGQEMWSRYHSEIPFEVIVLEINSFDSIAKVKMFNGKQKNIPLKHLFFDKKSLISYYEQNS